MDLRWEQIDFGTASLHVRRVKKGTPSTHPVLGDELRALRAPARTGMRANPAVVNGAPRSEVNAITAKAKLADLWREKPEQTNSGPVLVEVHWPHMNLALKPTDENRLIVRRAD